MAANYELGPVLFIIKDDGNLPFCHSLLFYCLPCIQCNLLIAAATRATKVFLYSKVRLLAWLPLGRCWYEAASDYDRGPVARTDVATLPFDAQVTSSKALHTHKLVHTR